MKLRRFTPDEKLLIRDLAAKKMSTRAIHDRLTAGGSTGIKLAAVDDRRRAAVLAGTTPWTPKIDGALIGMWESPLSGKEIAAALNRRFALTLTDRAVYGRAARIGLGNRKPFADRSNAAISSPSSSAPGDIVCVHSPPHWSPEENDLLRSLWARGESSRFIAAEISDRFGRAVSRCAVIARAERIGLGPHPKAVPRAPVRALSASLPAVRTCQFPIGEPGTEGFHLCGERNPEVGVVPGKPYCAAHCAVAYRSRSEMTRDEKIGESYAIKVSKRGF